MLRSFIKFLRDIWHYVLMKRRYPHTIFDISVDWRVSGNLILRGSFCIGANSVVVVKEGGILHIGSNVWLGRDCEIAAIGEITIGDLTSLQHRTQLHGDVNIGAGCLGAANLYISSHVHEFQWAPALPIRIQDTHRQHYGVGIGSRPVVIEDDCWLGINVVISPGVTVGRGCIVGANSVVTSDLPPYAIAAGSPAKIIRQRLAFEPKQSIRATIDDDAPYFYSGFIQLGVMEAEAFELKRSRGGFLAKNKFSIVLAIREGDSIQLEIDSYENCMLTHAGISQHVSVGSSVIVFNALPELRGVLKFNHDAEERALFVIKSCALVTKSST